MADESKAGLPEGADEVWRPFLGFNHNRVTREGPFPLGGVSFRDHLGYPLTRALWDDLAGRLGAARLYVYRDGDPEPASYFPASCIVRLDEMGRVHDILYTP